MPQSREPYTDWRVWQEPEAAVAFVNDRRAGIPGAQEQLSVLRQLLPKLPEGASPAVLDMGCGDGILLNAVLAHWTTAQGVALDGSPTMLDLARERFANLPEGKIAFVQSDFNEPNWREALPLKKFDAVVSGFAIHHSEDARKQEIYAEIFDLLNPGGVFVNIEHVASATPLGEELFEATYALNITRKRQEQGQNVTFTEVMREVNERLDKSANRLTLVETQLQWLREIGYHHVDCYWKYYELAILAGYKPL